MEGVQDVQLSLGNNQQHFTRPKFSIVSKVSSCKVFQLSSNIVFYPQFRYIPGFESTIVIENPQYQGFKSLMDCQEIYNQPDLVLSILKRLATFHGLSLIHRHKTCSDLSKVYPFLMKLDAYILRCCNLLNSSTLDRKGNELF